MSKHLLLALGAGGTATAAVVASAASLGTITSESLGSSRATITACDTNFTTDYDTAYDATLGGTGGYEVSSVNLAGLAAACDGLDMKITLQGTGGSSLEELVDDDVTLTGTLDARTFVWDTTAENVAAADVTGIAVSFSDDATD